MNTESRSEAGAEAMGFKDRERALFTVKYLEGRDITYQFRTIQNYYIRARKILKITKDEKKVKNITEAMQIFEEWMKDYKDNEKGKLNWHYLPLETVEAFRPLAQSYGISNDDFYKKYREVNGSYTALRTIKTDDGSTTWDILRNRRLKELINSNEEREIEWFDDEGNPTKQHLTFISLGFSPDSFKLKSLIRKMADKPADNDDKMETNEESKKGTKRNRISSSEESESDEEMEEPTRKKSRASSISSEESKDDEKLERKKWKAVPDRREEKKDQEDSGLSFKDKERASRSIESLNGRDVSYQYHAIAGLIKRAERVISLTKDEQKIKNMTEAVEIYENWIADYNANGRSKENLTYLPLNTLIAFLPLAKEYQLEVPEFVKAYEKVGGDYKKLRSVTIPSGEVTWDIERNKKLRPIIERIKDKFILWFETDIGKLRGLPTKEHTLCILWGYSVEPAKLKKLIPQLREKLNITD